MFPGAFKRRRTFRWALGRIISALVIALVFLVADYARASEPVDLYYLYGYPLRTTDRAQLCQSWGSDTRSGIYAFEPDYSVGAYPHGVCSIYNSTNPEQRLQIKDIRQTTGCPDGSSPVNGVCEPQCDPDASFSVVLDFGPSSIVDGSVTGIKERVVNGDGCEFRKGGVSACVVGKQQNGDPGASCSITYNATGNDVNESQTELPDSNLTPADGNSVKTPTVKENATSAPSTSELSDGTTKTTQTSTTTVTGGGNATITKGGSTTTINITENSNSVTTVTTTTTNNPDGSQTVTEQTSTTWKNGDSATVSTDGQNVTGTKTEGATGGSTTTKTNTTNADGSSTSNTTTDGGSGGGAAGGGGGSPNCSDDGCDENGGAGEGEDGNGGGGGDGDGEGEGEEFEGADLPEAEDMGSSYGRLIDAVYDSELVAPVRALQNVSGSGSCPTASFTIFDRELTIDMHCTILNDPAISGALSAVFMALWALLAIFIFFMA